MPSDAGHRAPCLRGAQITDNLPGAPFRRASVPNLRDKLEARARELSVPIDDADIWGDDWVPRLLMRLDGEIYARAMAKKAAERSARYQVAQ